MTDTMTNDHLTAEQDTLFLLENLLQWQRLYQLPAYTHADPELGKAVISEGARFAQQVLAPLNQPGDQQGCRLNGDQVEVPNAFRLAYHRLAEGGWLGLDQPVAYGGQALPQTLATVFAEQVNTACMAFGMMPCLTRAAATLLAEHAADHLKEKLLPALLEGHCGATIVITEPHAGSDVAAIKTNAIQQPDSSYQLTGSKIFITCGDQNYTEQILHLVLARVPGAESGSRGLSLFLVPKWQLDEPQQRNPVSVSRLEDKMGLKASPTCVLNFDRATGHLIGAEGEGLSRLFTMMNLMRLEVAVQSVGIATAASRDALRYASERHQGGETNQGIIQHADVRRMLTTMQVFSETLRALVLETSFNLDFSLHAESAEERRECTALVQFLLPVCKAWGAEQAFKVANLGVQVLGGQGFVRDAGMEQYVRDSRVLAIYEGTTGIQALDLVKRKLLRQRTGYEVLLRRIDSSLERHRQDASLAPLTTSLTEALAMLRRCSERLLNTDQQAVRDLEAAAVPYLDLVGHLVGAWLWLRMAAAAKEASPWHRQKRHKALFYNSYLLPAITVLEQQIAAGAEPIDRLYSA